jgi:hypothetical protein
MLRVRQLLTLSAAALTLVVATLAPAHASPWYDQWRGYDYQCRFTSPSGVYYAGHLRIDSVRPDSYDSYCCYWQGTCYFGNQSYPCEGYANRGRYCYFKLQGSYDWSCVGELSADLKELRGYYTDFQRCYLGKWDASYNYGSYNDSGYNYGDYNNGGHNNDNRYP